MTRAHHQKVGATRAPRVAGPARLQYPLPHRPLPLVYSHLECGHFFIRRAKNGYLDNQKVSEKIQHMAEKLSLRYVEIRGLF